MAPSPDSPLDCPTPRVGSKSSAAHTDRHQAGFGRPQRLDQRHRQAGRRNRHRSVGELGPWGSGRTRAQAELGIHSDGTVDLSAGAVLELAWNMGLLTWADSPKPGWYDTDGNLVPEEDIAERYHDEVVARSGIRPFEEGMGNDYKDGADEEEAEVFLDHDVTFSVAHPRSRHRIRQVGRGSHHHRPG